MNLNLCLKILSGQQIKQVDQYTMRHEPIASIDLMERASVTFVKWFLQTFQVKSPIIVICGIGNNGGDGLAIARLLKNYQYKVEVFCIGNIASASDDFKCNYKALPRDIAPIWLDDEACFPQLLTESILIDAIFGSGLSRAIIGIEQQLIHHLNQSICRAKVAVDIASGLGSDQWISDTAMEVSYTFTFQLPKLSFFLSQNDHHTGNLMIHAIGLNSDFINTINALYFFSTPAFVQSIIKKRPKYMHKGQAGRSLLIVGSYGKMGAAVLASKACIRSGVGLLTVHVPVCGLDVVQTTVPEAIVSVDQEAQISSKVPLENNISSIGIGAGIGLSHTTTELFQLLLLQAKCPLIIDADALTILSKNKKWMNDLPKGSILTPHIGEFTRLTGDAKDDYHRLSLQIALCKKYQVIVVLKGAYTSICNEQGTVVFNSTGNPGMATAGSGDVLLGVITALVAQGYAPYSAALLGVYLHGLSGDLATKPIGEASLVASDLIDYLPSAFRFIS